MLSTSSIAFHSRPCVRTLNMLPRPALHVPPPQRHGLVLADLASHGLSADYVLMAQQCQTEMDLRAEIEVGGASSVLLVLL